MLSLYMLENMFKVLPREGIRFSQNTLYLYQYCTTISLEVIKLLNRIIVVLFTTITTRDVLVLTCFSERVLGPPAQFIIFVSAPQRVTSLPIAQIPQGGA